MKTEEEILNKLSTIVDKRRCCYDDNGPARISKRREEDLILEMHVLEWVLK